MGMAKNKIIMVAIIAIVVIALAVTLVLVMGKGQNDLNPTDGTTQSTNPTETDPTEESTEDITEAPTEAPTQAPTEAPTEEPTEAPTEKPTEPKPTQPTMYTVTFKDHDGAILKTQKVEKGKGAAAPANPSREHFTFAGWDKSFGNVTSDLVVTATYSTRDLLVYAQSVTVNKGTSEVKMDICVANNPGIMGAVLKVTVDDNALAVTGGNKTGYPGLTLTTPGSATTSSPYTFMLDALEISDADKQDGTLFTVTFKVKNPNAIGKYNVTLSYDQGGIFDENFNDLQVVLGNGTITIQ